MIVRLRFVLPLAVFVACSSQPPAPAPGAPSAPPPATPSAADDAGARIAIAPPEAAASFRAAVGAIVAAHSQPPNAVEGVGGFLFFLPELRSVAAGRFWGADAVEAGRASRPEDRDPLPAIIDFERQLRDRGIDLLVVPVPPKALVYPDRLRTDLPGPEPRLDEPYREFLALLEKNGIRTLDLLPALIASRDTGVFCRQDTHWSPQGIAIAASRIAARVRSMAWYPEIAKTSYASEERAVEIQGDLWRTLPEPRPARETLRLRVVGTRDATGIVPVGASTSSPVVLLGDSYTLVFHAGGDLLASDAGLPADLALEIGFPVDLIAANGGGATARLSLRRRGDLTGKKLVVWCFGAREFTESQGWKLVPLAKANAKPALTDSTGL